MGGVTSFSFVGVVTDGQDPLHPPPPWRAHFKGPGWPRLYGELKATFGAGLCCKGSKAKPFMNKGTGLSGTDKGLT